MLHSHQVPFGYNMQRLSQPIELAKIVNIGVQFDRIGEIDTMNERFYAELTIEAQWKENKRIERFNAENEWTPGLYIENIINEPKVVIKYFTEYEHPFTIITERRTVKGSFWERLELHNFPFDIQALSVTIGSNLKSNEIKLIENKYRVFYNSNVQDTFIDQQKWRLYKFTDIIQSDLNDINNASKNEISQLVDLPKLRATSYVSRRPHYYIWNAFALIFLITVCSLNTFAIDQKLPQGRLQPAFTLLLTSISFKWVINRSLPTVSYLTTLDKYAIANIFILCLIACWHGVIASFWDVAIAKEIDKWILLSFGIGFLLVNFTFLLWYFFIVYFQLMKLKKKERAYKNIVYNLTNDISHVTKSTLSINV